LVNSITRHELHFPGYPLNISINPALFRADEPGRWKQLFSNVAILDINPQKGSNTTLRNHITHPHCKVIKAQKNQNPKVGQTSMARDGSVFRYDPDYLREQFAGLVIQRELPFNHFDHEQTTRVFQVISFEEFPSPHTGGALFKMLIKVLTSFNLEDKVMSITLDNANNNTSAMDKLKSKYDPPMEDFEEDVFDDDGQRNEVIPLSDEEIALDASSEGTLSPGGPRYDYMMSNEAEDDY
nr:hypothetical protein [Tanacetum cinerariifolium]